MTKERAKAINEWLDIHCRMCANNDDRGTDFLNCQAECEVQKDVGIACIHYEEYVAESEVKECKDGVPYHLEEGTCQTIEEIKENSKNTKRVFGWTIDEVKDYGAHKLSVFDLGMKREPTTWVYRRNLIPKAQKLSPSNMNDDGLEALRVAVVAKALDDYKHGIRRMIKHPTGTSVTDVRMRNQKEDSERFLRSEYMKMYADVDGESLMLAVRSREMIANKELLRDGERIGFRCIEDLHRACRELKKSNIETEVIDEEDGYWIRIRGIAK